MGGFTGTVTLAQAVSPSKGLTVSCDSTNLTLQGAGSISSTCIVSASSAGNYTISVVGTSSVTHSAAISATTTDFTVNLSLDSLNVQPGFSSNSTIKVTGLNGFAGTVTLSVSLATLTPSLSPPICITSPSFLALSATTPFVTSTLSCSLTPSTTAGEYDFTLTAASTPVRRTTAVVVSVNPPKGFQLVANSGVVAVQPGSSVNSPITITSLNGFAGSVTVAARSSPSGLVVFCNLSTVTLSTVGQSSCILTISVPSNVPVLNYTITITGTSNSSTITSFTRLPVQVFDFKITANPNSLTVSPGSSGVSVVSVTSLNDFAGIISLSTSISPNAALQISLDHTSVREAAGTSSTSSLIVNATGATTPGQYSVTVMGSGGSTIHSVTITIVIVQVGSFSISGNPSSLTIQAGASANATITLTSTNNFAGPVTLSVSSSPRGLKVSPTRTTVQLALGGIATSTLAFSSGIANNYLVTVNGTRGILSHTTSLTIRVLDFSLSSNPARVKIEAGNSSSLGIMLNSLNNFTGTVKLTVTGPASGPIVSISPTSASTTLLPGGSAKFSIFVSSTSTAKPGDYGVNVTAVSGSIVHVLKVRINVDHSQPHRKLNGTSAFLSSTTFSRVPNDNGYLFLAAVGVLILGMGTPDLQRSRKKQGGTFLAHYESNSSSE